MSFRVPLRWTLSLVALIAVNLVPLVGVFAFGWDAAVIVLLYWTENLVIGAYNILRLALVRAPASLLRSGKLFAIPFFALHFGGFCAVHGLFLTAFFKLGGGPSAILSGSGRKGFFVVFDLLASVFRGFWGSSPAGFRWLVIGLFVSHGVSFVQNYLLAGEREVFTVGELMSQPYKRIAVLHIAIVAGAVPVQLLDSPIVLLVILILLKIALDVYLHTREHVGRRPTGGRVGGRQRGRRSPS